MKELLYTILELEEWCSTKLPCSFCVSLREEDRIVCQIVTRSKVTHKLVALDFACQNCKEKFENDEMPKCERCGRLRVDSDTNYTENMFVAVLSAEKIRKRRNFLFYLIMRENPLFTNDR